MAWKFQNNTPQRLLLFFSSTQLFLVAFTALYAPAISHVQSQAFLLPIHWRPEKRENSTLKYLWVCVIKVRVRHSSVGKHILFEKEAGQVSIGLCARSNSIKCCQLAINRVNDIVSPCPVSIVKMNHFLSQSIAMQSGANKINAIPNQYN